MQFPRLQQLAEGTAPVDTYVLEMGEDGDAKKTTGDAAKIVKKLLSSFKRDMKDAGEDKDPKYQKALTKWEQETDPAKLFKALIKADMAWDGYALKLTKNGKEVSAPSGTRY